MNGFVFVAGMAAASALSFAKLLILAALLPAEGFAFYATTLAAAMFFTSLLSFGTVEQTIKSYSRAVVHGGFNEVKRHTLVAAKTLLVRAGFCIGVIWIAALLFDRTLAVPASLAVTFAFINNLCALYSSVSRAVNRLDLLLTFNLLRATAALLAASAAALSGQWDFTLLCEVLATATLLTAYAAFFLRSRADRGVPTEADETPAATADGEPTLVHGGGRWLFLAFLLASIPMTLDRSFLLQFETQAAVASYVFLANWPLAAHTFTSIFAQKFGPEIIRMELKGDDRTIVSSLLRYYALIMPLFAVGTAATAIVVYLFFREIYWDKYSLEFWYFGAVAVAAALQVAQLCDWVLVSFDRENQVAATSLVFAGATAVLFAANYLAGGGVGGYFVAVALGRAAQLVAQIWLVKRQQRLRFLTK